MPGAGALPIHGVMTTGWPRSASGRLAPTVTRGVSRLRSRSAERRPGGGPELWGSRLVAIQSHLAYDARLVQQPNPVLSALGDAGKRLTIARRAVAEAITEQAGHFTAEDVLAASR